MAFNLKVKTNTVAPASGALSIGELGYNTTTNQLFIGNGVSVSATPVIMGLENQNYNNIANVAAIQFQTSFNPGLPIDEIAGRVFYNEDEDTLNIVHANGSIQQIGHEFYMSPVNNNSGVAISNGDFIMATGATGDQITIAKAITNGTVDPIYMIGVATGDIAIGAEKQKITVHGLVRNFNTNPWTVGTILYPNPLVSGGWTSTKPIAPAIKTPIAMVVKQSLTAGIIYVRMTNGSKFGDTDSNVEFTNLANKELVAYNGINTRWENTPGLAWDFTNSRLGIGLTSPSEKLDVSGVINTTPADSVSIKQAGVPILSTFKHPTGSTAIPNGQNTFVGRAGNTTMGSTATQTYHASYNTGVGVNALYYNTIGSNNTANGYSALQSNTTGSNNTANGIYALQSNTTGSYNTANGYAALNTNTTGYNNTANGVNAGRYIADGSTGNTTGDYNVFIGAFTKALADNDQNEIVIGYNATGAGSNSVVLGNDSITKTVLKGNVGIGTTSPAQKLEVAGNARVSGQYQYGANAYTEYNATDKSIDFVFAE